MKNDGFLNNVKFSDTKQKRLNMRVDFISWNW